MNILEPEQTVHTKSFIQKMYFVFSAWKLFFASFVTEIISKIQSFRFCFYLS